MSEGDRMNLEWAVRESFLAYVSALPDGVIRAGQGARRDGNLFRLPGRRVSAGEYAFDGRLHFYGHAGVLDVTLDEICVSVDRAVGTVSAAIAGDRYSIAELADPQGICEEEGVIARFDTVTLTDDGAAVLGGVYPPGAAAAPITIRA